MLLAFNFSHAASDFCCLLMTFANSLDPYQYQLNVSPDLDPNRLTLFGGTAERIF